MKSMTGFGRNKIERNGREYTIEMKSVNHRYQEISVKLPRSLGSMEETIKKQVTNVVSRGKVDVFVTFNNYSEEGKNVIINQELALNYVRELKRLAKEADIQGEISVTEVFQMPDVLTLKIEDEESEMIKDEITQCLQGTLESFINMREQEGNAIKLDLAARITRVEEIVKHISIASTGLLEEYVVKLEERMKQLLKTDVVDKDRLAQEIVIYADKCSIEEELTRLNSHILQFKSLLEQEIPVGKKLDFLLQEMNRETNTIGSKSAGIEVTNEVITLKTELEDIREQIQNIE